MDKEERERYIYEVLKDRTFLETLIISKEYGIKLVKSFGVLAEIGVAFYEFIIALTDIVFLPIWKVYARWKIKQVKE